MLYVAILGGVSMTMIVLADYNNWVGAWSLAIAFGLGTYLLGSAAYKVHYKAPGQVEVYSILGILKLDLTKGYAVKRGHFGRAVVVIKGPKKRYRLNGALGDVPSIQAWLDAVPGV